MAIDVTGSVSVGGSISTAAWWELNSGDYVNGGAVLRLTAVEPSTNNWEISINNGQGPADLLHAGPFATKALAQAAIQSLVDGQGPST